MKNKESFSFRCFAELQGDQWVALCIDLELAAQADSYGEVRRKLQHMIQTYVYDAVVGVDREHREILMARKAPLWYFAKYYYLVALSYLHGVKDDVVKVFQERTTTTLKHC